MVMLIDSIVTWVGLIAVVLIIACACLAVCSWLMYRTVNSVRGIKRIFSLYWHFYNSIKKLPSGNYRKFKVVWDRDKGRFTDAEGIE